MRCVTSLLNSLVLGAFLTIALVTGTLVTGARAQSDAALSLTLPQARELAAQALKSGQPGLAIQLGTGLLKANPRDPFAHYVMASSFGQLNRPTEGRKAAARAYRFAKPGDDRIQAA